MALVECSECGRQISDKAQACPGCGAPVAVSLTETTATASKHGEVIETDAGNEEPRFGDIKASTVGESASAAIVKKILPSPAWGLVAVVLGVASVIMPYFAAVFLVPTAFVCGLISFVRGRRGLGVAGMVLAVIGLIGVVFVSQQITKIVKDPFAPNALTGSGSAPVVTLAEYELIRDGMTYQDVCVIIGDSGQELSRSEMAGYSSIMYSWKNENGSNMNAMFQNGKLVTKAQFGLR